ncbi:MAG TPA: hypothetical protein VHX18_07790 [Rhizomicrobium sp.]|jgi:hypothetical protein|nr:hypothetical protein [Rhizomicrobium sp.]
MRFEIGAALVAALALAGCMGPDGNPNGQPYATDTGGLIATAPQALGTVSYDPYAKPPSFADMDIGSVATMPPPNLPMNVMPMSPAPRPR